MLFLDSKVAESDGCRAGRGSRSGASGARTEGTTGTAALGQPGGKKGRLEGAPVRASCGFGSLTERKGRGEPLGEGEGGEPWSRVQAADRPPSEDLLGTGSREAAVSRCPAQGVTGSRRRPRARRILDQQIVGAHPNWHQI